MTARDMSAAQFQAALARNGLKETGYSGYVRIVSPVDPKSSTNVSHLNAGPNRRQKISYLLRERDRYHAAEIARDKFDREHATEIALWNQLRKGELA